jgi:putative copper resistance protein D
VIVARLMIAARAIHFGACLLLASALGFPALLGKAPSPDLRSALRRLAGGSLLAALLSGLAWFWLVLAQMCDDDGVSGAALRVALGETRFGHLWLLRLGLMLATGLFLRAPRAAAPLAAALLASLAWTGHASATPGWPGALHLGADVLHLLVGAVWPGGLLPAFLLLRQEGEAATSAIRRFSNAAALSVALLAATGLLESWFMLTRPGDLLSDLYGRILLAKILLFAGMVALGAANRRQIGRNHAGLRRNLALELALGSFVLLAVGALGIAPPPGHSGHP